MSVRPITHSEVQLAYGAPWTNWLVVIGATQGLIAHFRFHGTTPKQAWMPTPMARLTLPVFLLGGAAVGAFVGVQGFGDDALRRLHQSHYQD